MNFQVAIYEDKGIDERNASEVTSQMQQTYEMTVKETFLVNSKAKR